MALLNDGMAAELEPARRLPGTTGGSSTTQPVVADPSVASEPITEPTVAGPDAPGGSSTTQPISADPTSTGAPGSTAAVDPIDEGGIEVPRDDNGNIVYPSDSQSGDPSVQDLYPEMPDTGEFEVPDVVDPTGATVTQSDLGEGNVQTPTDATSDTGTIVQGAVDEVVNQIGSGEQTGLTAEQQVDAELARILGQDSPLLASARAEAMRMMNARGLTNTSMAAGATYAAMVDAAMPMAQQNAQQAFTREMANTELRQQTNQLSAEQTAALRALEAELGQELSIFNADQLATAQRLTAELRSAMEQGNAQAYNDAALQLAELQRDAEAQQADLEGAAAEREFLERQAYQEQILDIVGRLNEQFMIGEQQIDLQNVIGTYQQITSINETAATLMDSYLRSIGSIYDDPAMSTSQAAEAIRQMVTMLEGSMRLIENMNSMDFGDINGLLPGGASGTGAGTGGPGGGDTGGPGGGPPLEDYLVPIRLP